MEIALFCGDLSNKKLHLSKNQKKQQDPERAKMKNVSFNIPAEDEAALNDAIEATGLSQTQIIIQALRSELPQIVKKWNEKRAAAAKKFLSKINGGGAPQK